MKCPSCSSASTSVTETREAMIGAASTNRRRRRCVCGFRFTTYEIVYLDDTRPRPAAVLSEHQVAAIGDLMRLSTIVAAIPGKERA